MLLLLVHFIVQLKKEVFKRMNCCDFLLNQICFFPEEICPCCSTTIENTPLRPKTDRENSLSFNLNMFFDLREKYIKEFKDGSPFCYKNCTLYEPYRGEYKQNNNIPFNYITISNRTYCNCNCIYCEQTHNSSREEMNKFKSYDIIPILEELQQKKLIAPNCKFVLSGGEVAEYPQKELQYIFNLSKRINGSLLLLSSGIRYSEEIADVLRTHNTFMTVSVDSGTKETYKKIKRVDAYEQTWKNLKQYIHDAKNNPNADVEIKYIVIPGVNDSLYEAKKFIEKCIKIKCKYIKAEIEHFYMKENYDKPMPENSKEVFRYFFEITKKKKINLMIEGVGRNWVISKINE